MWDNYDFDFIDGAYSIDSVLNANKGNCATLTTFLALLFKRLGIDSKVMTFGNHVFLSFQSGEKRVDIECTNPFGFDTSRHKDRPGIRTNGLEVLPALLYHNYAEECFRRGNLFEAIQCVRKTLDIFPECTLAYKRLADYHAFSDNIEEAVKEMEKAIELDPYFSYLYAELAMFHADLGNYEESARNLQKALYFFWYDGDVTILGRIMKVRNSLLSRVNQSEAGSDTMSTWLDDIIYHPLCIRDSKLFNQFVNHDKDLGVFKVDFKGDKRAYWDIGLDDLIDDDRVMVAGPKSSTFREAKQKNDGLYYFSNGKRVTIATGTRFYLQPIKP